MCSSSYVSPFRERRSKQMLLRMPLTCTSSAIPLQLMGYLTCQNFSGNLNLLMEEKHAAALPTQPLRSKGVTRAPLLFIISLSYFSDLIILDCDRTD